MPTQFFDIILLAMIAAFVAFRLYSVLGRRTGHERPRDEQVRVPDARAKETVAEDNVVKLPERGAGAAGRAGPLAHALMDVKLADRHFDEERFMEGAKAAYEMIVTAFAKGERDTLRPLLSQEVFATFDSAIAQRERNNERLEFTFLGLQSARITAAELKGRNAEITVRFESNVIEAKYDSADRLVEGHANAPAGVTDVWTFARDMRARDPNWALVATAAG